MISLFIDTSLSDVSIAILKSGKVLSLIHNDIPMEHSIYVSSYIEKLMKDNNLKAKDINEIIVVNGPGSFTGIRIGVTIAKVFAYLTNIRIVSISSLKAKALSKKGDKILSIIDAKHDNYYAGLYDEKYNTILEKFCHCDEIDNLKDEYNPIVASEQDDYNIEKIVEYSKQLPSENVHLINPIYLKLPEAMEKK